MYKVYITKEILEANFDGNAVRDDLGDRFSIKLIRL
jgi:hypothetical protein